MRLTTHADVQSFIAAAGPLLSEDEARHNLHYGICSTLRDAPDVYRDARLWTVEDGGDVLAALLLTPPHNVVVAKPRDDRALAFAAAELARVGVRPPGVVGALPEVDVFADAWELAAGALRRVRMAQGIYAARATRQPRTVAGAIRFATARDRELLIEWISAFQAEALPEARTRRWSHSSIAASRATRPDSHSGR